MPSRFARLFALASAFTLVLLLQASATGQEPALEVYYTKLEPKDQFKYKWKGKEAVCNVGVFRWEVPQTEFGTNGLDRNFTGYCAEILVPITEDKLYRFRVNSLFEPSNYDGLAGKDNAATAAQKRAIYIQELFGRYFRDPVLKAVNPDEALALQVALWEVIQETEPAEGQPLKLDLFSGDFQANYPKADAPAYVLKAQNYLDSLTGNDALFYQNPDLRGRELIRLMGIPNANNVVAQSQFALRFAGGGGVGAGSLSRALTTGGGLVGLGGGPGGAGFGPNGLAPFLGAGGGGSSPSGGTPTTPGGGATTPPVSGPSTPSTPSTPGTPTTPTPPVDGPPPNQPPTTPVPAPAGLLLGAIALGTLGTWRLGARLLAGK